jgi:hypothetical protein
MALMAACGELTPMPEYAIFADTGEEPEGVYKWLDWLEKQLPFPVIRVQNKRGRLSYSALDLRKSKKSGNTYLKTGLPAFYTLDGKKAGLGTRQCTLDFKIDPIRRKQRELRGGRNGRPVITWIGISTDEIIRMKPSRDSWNTHIWPLIDKGISREGCLQWMEQHKFPKPPRSACVFCPYHSDREWARLKREEPEEFAKAVKFEKRLQKLSEEATAIKGMPFLHRSYQNLEDVSFDSAAPQENDLFGNDCEGICGV